MDDELTRIGVSLPSSLLRRFDDIIRRRGYSSRSEGIRDAIRDYIVEYDWMSGEEGEKVGVVTMIYDHHQKGLSDSLTDLQHDYGAIINVTLHLHLDHDNCLEVILVRGEAEEVREVTERMMSLKGVKHVRLTTTGHA